MRRACALALIMIGLSGLSFAIPGSVGRAQAPTRDQRTQPDLAPTGTASIAGVVLDTEKVPVRRALVSITGDMHVARAMTTDEAGRFSFTGLPAGRFTVTAEKGGYPSRSYGAKAANRTGAGILLADAQAMQGIVLTLAKGAVITGTVFDEHGQIMPDLPVMAWLVHTSLTGARTIVSGSDVQTTDDRGVYRIYGLPPGEYTIGTAWYYSSLDVRVPTDAEIAAAFLAATKPAAPVDALTLAPVPPPPQQHYSYASTYITSTVDPLAAATLTLAPGDVREGIDLHMQFQPMSHIEGLVTNPDGSPAASVSMVLFRKNRAGPQPTTFFGADSHGHFATTSLAPGDYAMMATQNATASSPQLWALQDVTINGPAPAVLSLRLQTSMTMTGRMVFNGTSPPPDPTKARLQMLPLEGTSATFNSASLKADPTGTFSLSGLTPGRFVLRVALVGAPAWQLASITVGGREVLDLPLEIGTIDPPETIITFTDQTSNLSGVVSAPAGQLASDFFVVALPADRAYWIPQSRRIRSARPGTDGRYEFVGLPPGDYVLAATTDFTQSDQQDPAVLAELAAHALPVTIGVGQTKTLDLRLGGGGRP